MKIVGIYGSPRKNGNSAILLDRALEGVIESGDSPEKVFLNDLDIKPCISCGRCAKSGACAIKDDMGIIREKIGLAEALIIASPVYFTSVSALVKIMVDRFHCAWVAKNMLKRNISSQKKIGAFICVSAQYDKSYMVNARRIMRSFFNTADIEYGKELYCGGFDEKGSIEKDKKAMMDAYQLGRFIAAGKGGDSHEK